MSLGSVVSMAVRTSALALGLGIVRGEGNPGIVIRFHSEKPLRLSIQLSDRKMAADREGQFPEPLVCAVVPHGRRIRVFAHTVFRGEAKLRIRTEEKADGALICDQSLQNGARQDGCPMGVHVPQCALGSPDGTEVLRVVEWLATHTGVVGPDRNQPDLMLKLRRGTVDREEGIGLFRIEVFAVEAAALAIGEDEGERGDCKAASAYQEREYVHGS